MPLWMSQIGAGPVCSLVRSSVPHPMRNMNEIKHDHRTTKHPVPNFDKTNRVLFRNGISILSYNAKGLLTKLSFLLCFNFIHHRPDFKTIYVFVHPAGPPNEWRVNFKRTSRGHPPAEPGAIYVAGGASDLRARKPIRQAQGRRTSRLPDKPEN